MLLEIPSAVWGFLLVGLPVVVGYSLFEWWRGRAKNQE